VIVVDMILFSLILVTWFLLALVSIYFQRMVATVLDVNDQILKHTGLNESNTLDDSQTTLADFTKPAASELAKKLSKDRANLEGMDSSHSLRLAIE
tara:strand:- start:1560 stop:1847 length:288 start_codon:yes stop_codon:yes gene_type:complete